MSEFANIGKKASTTLYLSSIGKVLSLAITILIVLLFARELGPSDFGVYIIALGYAGIFGSVSHLGVGSYFTKGLAENSYKKDKDQAIATLANGYVLVVIGSAILLILALLGSFVASSYLNKIGIPPLTFMLASMDVIASIFWGVTYMALIGFGDGGSSARTTVIVSFAQIVAGFLLIKMGFGVNGAIVGMLAGDVIGMVVSLLFLSNSIPAGSWIAIKNLSKLELSKILKFSIPLTANNIVTTIVANASTLLLGYYAGSIISGNYGAAMKSIGVVIFLYGVMATVLIQAFSMVLSSEKHSHDIEKALNYSTYYSMLFLLPIIVFIAVFSVPLIKVMFTQSYSSAPLMISLLSAGVALGFVVTNAANLFISSNKTKELFIYSFSSSVVQLAALLLLVPRFGAIGLIIAIYYIGNIVNLLLYSMNLKRMFSIKLDYRMLIRLAASSCVLLMILYFMPTFGNSILQLVAGAVATCLLYPPILATFRAVDHEALNTVKSVLPDAKIVGMAFGLFKAYSSIFINMYQNDDQVNA